MEERLQKLLSAAGICSRRAAEGYIIAGRVTVNGSIAQVGEKADPDRDLVQVDGRTISRQGAPIWIMLYKPRGYVTTLSDEKGRKTAGTLVAECGRRVWPVGRLDLDSEGLLLFTDDGAGTNRILHPSHETEKEYHVTVTGDVKRAVTLLNAPMELDGELLAPARAELLRQRAEGGVLSVVIHQGKNRQVRRMCALSGLEVKRLVRVREGELVLEGLKPGDWRYLTPEEVERLFSRPPLLQD